MCTQITQKNTSSINFSSWIVNNRCMVSQEYIRKKVSLFFLILFQIVNMGFCERKYKLHWCVFFYACTIKYAIRLPSFIFSVSLYILGIKQFNCARSMYSMIRIRWK